MKYGTDGFSPLNLKIWYASLSGTQVRHIAAKQCGMDGFSPFNLKRETPIGASAKLDENIRLGSHHNAVKIT